MITVPTRRRGAAAAIAIGAIAAVALSSCSSSGSKQAGGQQSGGTTGGGSVALAGFSTPKPAYDALSAAFQKTAAGKGVTFAPSYGPSGTQAQGVLSGTLKADYVALSTGADMSKLVPSKVASTWDQGPTDGIGADSVVVLVVRKGNPLGIKTWSDLLKPGVQIVTPDPASSGSAKWNLLAAYEQVIAQGGTAAQASAYVKSFYSHVVNRATSGSTAAAAFEAGTGNVLVSYESEAIYARQKGEDIDYVIPPQTMLIQTPVAVTTDASSAAKNFLSYVESSAGQQIFASAGWRPALTGVNPGTVKGAEDPSDPYPTPAKLITIASLGGWSVANTKFFGTDGILTKLDSAS